MNEMSLGGLGPHLSASSLAFQALHWDRLVDTLPIGICTCDSSGRLVQYNDQAALLWGRTPETGSSGGQFCGAVKAYRMGGEQLPLSETPMAEALRTGKPVRGREVVLERPDGSRIVVQANVEPLFDEDGVMIGGVNCFQDITARKEDERKLRESEHHYKELLQALPAAIYTTDLDGRITFYNEAAVEFAGRRPELGEMWCVTWRLYHADGTPLPHDKCPMAVALQERRPVRGAESIAERPDGSRIWFTPYPTPLTDTGGQIVGAINMLVDTTHRKEAVRQQRLLNDELNHRVKNTLATVQSLIAQTTRNAGSVEEYRHELEARIMAMSRAHDQLSHRYWSDADLGEVIRASLAPYRNTRSIILSGEPIIIAARTALMLAMVFHELATNAAKYGALANPDGKVELGWSVEANGQGRVLRLGWIESGGPPVTPSTRRGFGTRLLERGIRSELRGRAEIQFAPKGVRCAIEVPLDPVR
jgi:PAS domain S-box-containing protein